MKEEKIITVIGSANYDMILKQERLPQIGETYCVDNIAFSSGGKGVNQATQCSKLGVKTYFVGTIGNDFFGEHISNSLKEYKVNLDYLEKVRGTTGLGIVNALHDGSVYANIVSGANGEITIDRLNVIKPLLEKSSIVIFQLEIPVEVVEAGIRLAKECDCVVILNGAPANLMSEKVLRKVDYFVVNEPEASFYAKQPIFDEESARIHAHLFDDIFDHLLIITLGAKGSILYDKENIVHIPAKKVHAIDTTGAGDSFIGAFAYKILKDSNYIEAAKFATQVSSITVTKIGTQESMPSIDEITKY
ncbi:MAG: ribokinase [Firmicutes bacterium HGW-Firmicutes-1]|jgi:ribokinase|nr:MAG: ribokinase [Firmicutes bacterium HGW-Firmicutes-1]